jgi:dihydrofolate reductase
MRKLFSFNMISLDGFFEGPEGELDWHNVDDEFNQFAIEQLSSVGTLLFGRRTYQLMAGYWPTQEALTEDPDIAGMMNSLPKFVVTRTLNTAEWQNTSLLKGHIGEEITKVKQLPGGDIALFGSAILMAALMEMDLIDEHRIMVAPVILGSGIALFKGIQHRQHLKLVRSRSFKSGNVLLSYQPEMTG